MKDVGKNRKAACYEHLKSAILTMQLTPGSDLDEASLSDQFGLSRTPLREVLRQLAGEGYTELRENRGARVSELSYTTLRAFFLAAPMIYGAILRLAALNAIPAQIEELKAVQSRFKSALRSGIASDRALANNRFHEVTGEMASNVYLLPSFKRLLIDHARISMTFYQPTTTRMAENVSLASQQHDEIIAAIEARDDRRAAALADAHWNLSRGEIELFVTPNALDVPLGELPVTATAEGE